MIDPVLLDHRFSLRQDKAAVLQHLIVDAGRHHLPDEEGVVAAGVGLDHPTLQVAVALLDQRAPDHLGRDGRQARAGELVAVAAAGDPAPVHLVHYVGGWDVDGELALLLDEVVAVPLRGHADADHERADADVHEHPKGDDVRVSLLVDACYQDDGGRWPGLAQLVSGQNLLHGMDRGIHVI